MKTYTFDDYRNMLGSLNGEDSPEDSTSRDRFINTIRDDIYSRQRWDDRKTSSDLVFIPAGVNLPSDFSRDGFYDLREDLTGTGADNVYTLIEEKYKDNYVHGDYVVWISAGKFYIHEADSPTLKLTYYKEATDLAGDDDPDWIPAMVVAKGAYALLKRSEDEELDIRPFLSDYENEIVKLKAQSNRNIRTRLVGPREKYGSYIGKI